MSFLYQKFFIYLRLYAQRLVRGGFEFRTPASVEKLYDAYYKNKAKSERQYDAVGYILWDGKIIKDRVKREAWHRNLDLLVERIRKLQPETVLEVGCGNGQTIFYLADKFPHIQFKGVDISAVGVRQANEKARPNTRFEQRDATAGGGWGEQADLVFTYHALEMMPRVFPRALENIFRLARKYVILYEPIPELMPWTLRGGIARFIIITNDRLRNVMNELRRTAKARNWVVLSARRTGFAANPLNETSEVIIVPSAERTKYEKVFNFHHKFPSPHPA